MKFALTSLFWLLLMMPSLANADDEPPTGSVALLCKMSRHAQLTTQTLAIDYDQKLVNGYPATFTVAMIDWLVKMGSKVEHHQLNRVTGSYTFWIEDAPTDEPTPTFSCDKAVDKF